MREMMIRNREAETVSPSADASMTDRSRPRVNRRLPMQSSQPLRTIKRALCRIAFPCACCITRRFVVIPLNLYMDLEQLAVYIERSCDKLGGHRTGFGEGFRSAKESTGQPRGRPALSGGERSRFSRGGEKPLLRHKTAKPALKRQARRPLQINANQLAQLWVRLPAIFRQE